MEIKIEIDDGVMKVKKWLKLSGAATRAGSSAIRARRIVRVIIVIIVIVCV